MAESYSGKKGQVSPLVGVNGKGKSLVLAQFERFLVGQDMQVNIELFYVGVEVRIAKKIRFFHSLGC